MEFICFSLLIVWQLGINNANECPGKNGFACCHGYFWDRTENKCFPCMDGYTGVNCSTPCPDSFYGQGCLLSCSCSIDLCHHVYGCRISQGTTADVKEFPYSLSASNAVLTPLYSGTKGTEYKERAPATDGFRIASSIFLVLAFILLAFYACSILAPKRSCLKLLIIIRPSAENR
ncbi:uncharacterized protein LOC111103134 isoform X2 [Crassostrea virginica]